MPMPVAHVTAIDDHLQAKILKFLVYCRANDWAGYDPYDALNSRMFAALPFLNARLPRLILTQALKRSPIGVRPLLVIPKTQNPKAMALFLSAFVKLSRIGVAEAGGLGELMVERLIPLRSPGIPYSCLGYHFPCQTPTHFAPPG